MTDDPMTLVERLRNPAWEHSNAPFESPQLAKKETLDDMADAADHLNLMQVALSEAERFMAYFANETDGHFSGPGTPTTCLAQIRAVLSAVGSAVGGS